MKNINETLKDHPLIRRAKNSIDTLWEEDPEEKKLAQDLPIPNQNRDKETFLELKDSIAAEYKEKTDRIKALLIKRGLVEKAKDDEYINSLVDKRGQALELAIEDAVAVKAQKKKQETFTLKIFKESAYESPMPIDHVLTGAPQYLSTTEHTLVRCLFHWVFRKDGYFLLKDPTRPYRLPVNFGSEFIYCIPWRFLQKKTGEKNIAILRQQIKSLSIKNIPFIWTQNGITHKLSGVTAQWLGDYDDTHKEYFIFSYSPLALRGIVTANHKLMALKQLKSPPYSKPYPPHKFNLKGKYTVKFYDILYTFKKDIENAMKDEGLWEMLISDIYAYLNLDPQKTKFFYLNRRILKPTIQEVNQKTNLRVELLYNQGYGQVSNECIPKQKCISLLWKVDYGERN